MNQKNKNPEAVSFSNLKKIPVMAWFSVSKGESMLSQLLEISFNNMIIYSSSHFNKNEPVVAELQLPNMFPETTEITGIISQCEEIIQHSLYILNIHFVNLNNQSKYEIEAYLNETRLIEAMPVVEEEIPERIEKDKDEINLSFGDITLTEHIIKILLESLGDTEKSGREKFVYPLKGTFQNHSSDNNTMNFVIQAMGSKGVVFDAEEYFFNNFEISLGIDFPTNELLMRKENPGDEYLSIIPVIIKKCSHLEKKQSLYRYHADYSNVKGNNKIDLYTWILALMIRALGKEKFKELVNNLLHAEKALEEENIDKQKETVRHKFHDISKGIYHEIDLTRNEAKIVNISDHRIKLIANKYIQINDRVGLILNQDGSDKKIKIHTTVKWSHYFEKENLYEIGLHIPSKEPEIID